MTNQANELCVGIDLGTTNSVIAFTNTRPNGDLVSRVFSVRRSNDVYYVAGSGQSVSTVLEPTLPSVVYYSMESGYQPIVGNFARHQYAIRPHLVARSIKSQMGQPRVTGLSPDVPDETPAKISSRILKHLIADMSRKFRTPIEEAIITVPASFDAIMCEATREAARLAGLRIYQEDGSEMPILLSEPNAVIYDLINQIRNGEVPSSLLDVSSKKRVLVFDLGGGTLDVSLHEIEQDAQSGSLMVDEVATNRYTRLGGDDFDRLIADAMYQRLYTQYHKHPEIQNKIVQLKEQIYPQLLDKAEGLKLSVSMAQEDVLGSGWGDDEEEDLYPVGGRISTLGYAYDDSFTREEIEEILSPLMGKDLTIDQYQNMDTIENTKNIIFPILDVLNKASRDTEGPVPVDAVVLNGGMSKFYLIESRLEEFFGFKPITAVDPDQSVARGAAIYHYLLKHNQIAKGKGQVEQLQEEGLDRKETLGSNPADPSGSNAFGASADSENVQDVSNMTWTNSGSSSTGQSLNASAGAERTAGFRIRQTSILNESLYLQGQNDIHRKIIEAGTKLPHESAVLNGFMIRAGQNKIAIPIEHRSYDGSYRIIANGVVNLNTVYEQNLHVRLQMNLSSSKILSLRAWIVENSDSEDVLEEVSAQLSVSGVGRSEPKGAPKMLPSLIFQNTPRKVSTGNMQGTGTVDVSRLLRNMKRALESMDRVTHPVQRGEKVKEAARIGNQIASCANKKEAAFPVLALLKNTTNGFLRERLFIIARKLAPFWTERQTGELVKIAKVYLTSTQSYGPKTLNRNGANIEAIHTISACGKPKDALDILGMGYEQQYRNPLLNLCGKQQVAIDWISRCFLEDADAVFLRKPCKISESTRALGNALRLSSGQRVAMSSRDFYMEKLIALLQSGSLFDFEVDSCLVALGSIGDQRFADNTVDEKMLERARSCISRVPDIYIDVLATRFDRAREVVDMLLSGQKLEADQEAYLLVMLEGND